MQLEPDNQWPWTVWCTMRPVCACSRWCAVMRTCVACAGGVQGRGGGSGAEVCISLCAYLIAGACCCRFVCFYGPLLQLRMCVASCVGLKGACVLWGFERDLDGRAETCSGSNCAAQPQVHAWGRVGQGWGGVLHIVHCWRLWLYPCRVAHASKLVGLPCLHGWGYLLQAGTLWFNSKAALCACLVAVLC